MQYRNDNENFNQETTQNDKESGIDYEEYFREVPFQCMPNCPFLLRNKQRAYEDDYLAVIGGGGHGGGGHGGGGYGGGHGGGHGGGYYNHGHYGNYSPSYYYPIYPYYPPYYPY